MALGIQKKRGKRLTVASGVGVLAVVAAASVISISSAAADPDSQKVTQATPGWGLIGRNSFGSPQVSFEAGPQTPPEGKGSLLLSVEGPETSNNADADKVNWGNQSDFNNLFLKGDHPNLLNTLKYSLYIDEDGDVNHSWPGLALEVDPDVEGAGYANLVYLPNNSAQKAGSTVNHFEWTEFDAMSDDSQWYSSTGAVNCPLSSPCTWSELQDNLGDDAKIKYSLGFQKGRDDAFHGNVDALQVNTNVYDFEPVAKGAKGDQGDQGEQGPQGPAGSGDQPAAESSAASGPDRIKGADRYGTSVEIVKERYPGSADVAYIASGQDGSLVDSLSASNLVAGPILLVPSCGTLPTVVAEELESLDPERVTALGGEAAVCDEMLEQAKTAAGL